MLRGSLRAGLVVLLIGTFIGTFALSTAEPSMNDAFERTWERTDRPVAEGYVSRTWMWGPQPFTDPLTEEYAESPGTEREVQYFDKSRMEITDPDAADDGLWYVTNGLLVVELITGEMQVGHNTFESRSPAGVNVAGDPDDADGPTYASFSGLLDASPAAFSEALVQRVDRAGTVTDDSELGARGITAVHIDEETNHAIAEPFWAFMNSSGTVWEDGQSVEAQLFINPYYATGRPITEAYWAEVLVGGTPHDVLMQCFERRCLTYTPDNPEGWQVEAGNVGQHYYNWRYEQHIDEDPSLPTQTPDPSPTTTLVDSGSGEAPGAQTPTPPPTTVPIAPGPDPTATPTPAVTPTATAPGGNGAPCTAGTQAMIVQVTDGLGNTNPNSFAQGTGGDWTGGLDNSPTIQVGTTLRITVTASGECPIEYRFHKQPTGGSFQLLRGWSSDPTFTYTIQPEDYGMWFIIIPEIRDADPRSRFNGVDDYTYLTYIVDGPAPPGASCVAETQAKIVRVTDGLGNTNPNSFAQGMGGDWVGGLDAAPVISVGTTLSITVTANGDCPIEYRFQKQPTGGSFQLLRDWSSDPTFTYTIRQEDYGTWFYIIPEIRDSDPRTRFGGVDDYNYLSYVVE